MHTQINRLLLRNRVQYGNMVNLPRSALLTAGRERWALTTSPSHSWDKDLGISFSSDVKRAKNYFVASLYLKPAFCTAHYSLGLAQHDPLHHLENADTELSNCKSRWCTDTSSPPLQGNNFPSTTTSRALSKGIRIEDVVVHVRRDSPHLVDKGNGLACAVVLLWRQLHVCFDDISRLRCQSGQDSRKDPTAKIQQGHEHWIQLVCNRAKGTHSDTIQARNTHAAWQSESYWMIKSMSEPKRS